MNETSLLSNCTSGGCGAKIGPGELSEILSKLPKFWNENLLVGFESSDDASVFKINEKQSIVNTLDFFSPMIDDALRFGRIAATNALSDVYAMGGTPITALNIVCFPEHMDLAILQKILEGGAEKVLEANAVLSGGHSIYDKEPKYGLSVSGLIDNDKILRNNSLKIGDDIILTKALGVGIVLAAHRVQMADASVLEKAVLSMERLNKYAAEKMLKYRVSACTDVTGFGLLSHMLEMADGKVSIRLEVDNLPFITEAYGYANDYLLTAAGQRNRNHLLGKTKIDSLDFAIQELLFDPQTSGGLLISLPKDESEALLLEIQKDDKDARIIASVLKLENDIITFA